MVSNSSSLKRQPKYALKSSMGVSAFTIPLWADLLAVVYQNRRYDPDYLALRRLVRGDRLGEVFHVCVTVEVDADDGTVVVVPRRGFPAE